MLDVYVKFALIKIFSAKDFRRNFAHIRMELMQNACLGRKIPEAKSRLIPFNIRIFTSLVRSKFFLHKFAANKYKKLNSASPYTSFAIIPTTPLGGRYYCKGNTGGLQKINTKHLDLEK